MHDCQTAAVSYDDDDNWDGDNDGNEQNEKDYCNVKRFTQSLLNTLSNQLSASGDHSEKEEKHLHTYFITSHYFKNYICLTK